MFRHRAALLDNFAVIELTTVLAGSAGALRRDHGRPFADMIVAASALENNLVLITRNEKHFRGILGLTVLVPY